MYKKGIQVLGADAESYQAGKREEDIIVAVRHIGSAYASIADLYMTDLCDEPEAEEHCQNALNEAFKVDKDNIEAHQSMANLRLVRNNDQEAKKHLTVVFQQIQKIREALNEVAVIDVMKQQSHQNINQLRQMPSVDFRLHTANLLVKIEEYKKSVKILDSII